MMDSQLLLTLSYREESMMEKILATTFKLTLTMALNKSMPCKLPERMSKIALEGSGI